MKNTPKRINRDLFIQTGRKGGLKTAKRGKDYFREIGKKGLAKRYGKGGDKPLTP